MMIPIMQTVSTKGQLVIPAAIRKTLGIKPGSKVVLSIDENKQGVTATLVDDDPIKSAAGFLKKYDTDGKMFQRLLAQKREEIKRGE